MRMIISPECQCGQLDANFSDNAVYWGRVDHLLILPSRGERPVASGRYNPYQNGI